jgi:hypothetical protein
VLVLVPVVMVRLMVMVRLVVMVMTVLATRWPMVVAVIRMVARAAAGGLRGPSRFGVHGHQSLPWGVPDSDAT